MRRAATAGAVAAALLLTGCAARSAGPLEQSGGEAAAEQRVSQEAGQERRAVGTAEEEGRADGVAQRARRAEDGRAQGSEGARTAGLPPVVDHIPTRDKVVFLTYDDGAERDPRFIDLVRVRKLPVTMFLTDSVVGPAYGHFARLRSVGASLQNHTLDHRALRGLPYAGQRAEICGQQHKLKARFGIRPTLFRPPYGRYDTTTLRAAADCGIATVVLWRASVTLGGDLTYTHGRPRLRPGDIIAVDPDNPTGLSLEKRTERVLRKIEERGLRVGRLEDYL
ncbi:polysaccharide deacetylase family protein [Streptomyces sp. TRM68367]|uniref:polysaccharide deacetylase family protein n=1 Tax=Streptomyces sp. TRM68367 TaxID=2758415 RepID=UPI00165B9EC9|nr:polysaccharide deacetylase family protein [Streptomyces sp. TRM68367]MBC9725723.1 polysaccharide deacetylase family protein [Streptomyces sp. TRM68367]